jgi:hypothetical protein
MSPNAKSSASQMPKLITIYCEGKKGSHDYDLLDKVREDLPSSPQFTVQIVPIGSVRGAKAIINYREENGVTGYSSHKLFFRDRDFDRAIPDQSGLEPEEGKNSTYVYFSYRNTIENYLFDPHHFFDFCRQERLYANLFASPDEVKVLFIDAAQKLKYYQAVRHAMGKLRTDKTNFGTKLTGKSGGLPPDLSEAACKSEAMRLIETAKGFTAEWTPQGFDQTYQTFIDKFSEPVFFTNFSFWSIFRAKTLLQSSANCFLMLSR